MANEISFRHISTGKALYFTIRRAADAYLWDWNAADWDAPDSTNWLNYTIALAELGSCYIYTSAFPAISAGWYVVDIYERAGGGVAISDALLESRTGYWDGTMFKSWGADTTHIAGTAQTARDLGAGVLLANEAMGGTSLVLTLSGLVINASRAGGAVDIDNDAGPGIHVAVGVLVSSELNYGIVVGADTAVAINGTHYGLKCYASEGPGVAIQGTARDLQLYNGTFVNGSGVSIVDKALSDINLDHLVGTATDIPAVPAGTYLDQIMDDGTASYSRTTDSLQAIRDNMGTAQTGDSYAIVNHGTYGNAQLARTGADGDTLETISDQLDTTTVDIYTARVDFRHNKISGDDEYTVYWYRNGVIQTGTSSGKIGVRKNDAGGTALVTADTDMTALSTTGAFFFAADNTAGKLWVTGQALVTVKATIDVAERTDYAVVSRELR